MTLEQILFTLEQLLFGEFTFGHALCLSIVGWLIFCGCLPLLDRVL